MNVVIGPRQKLGKCMDEGYFGIRDNNNYWWRCMKCGCEFACEEAHYCPKCGEDLTPDLIRDVREYTKKLHRFGALGVGPECSGCERRNNGKPDTCIRCVHEKLCDAASLIDGLVTEIERLKDPDDEDDGGVGYDISEVIRAEA